MANIRGMSKDTMHRIAVVAKFPQQAPMTGFNVALRMCNDRLTDKQIKEGKGQSGPMLVYNKYTDKEGNEKISNTIALSAEQMSKIEAAANDKGDAPVVNARVFPKGKGLMIDTNSLETPKAKYDKAKDAKNTEKIRAVAAEKRAERENQMAAQAEQQASVQAEGPDQEAAFG